MKNTTKSKLKQPNGTLRRIGRNKYVRFLPYIAPAFIIWFVFQIYPNLQIFYLSLFKWDGMSTEKAFVGLQNFRELALEPTIGTTIKNSLIYIFFLVVIQNVLGVIFAVVLNRNTTFNKFFRTLFFAPLALGTIMVGMVWGYIFDPNLGILNNFFGMIGLEKLQCAWLTTPILGICCVAFVHAWHYLAYTITLTIAALQNIPMELYEAADVDGVGRVQQFFYITLPLLKGTILRLVVLSVCGAAISFDYVYALSGGSYYASNLDTLAVFMYRSIRGINIGKTAAIGVIIMVIVLAIYLIQSIVARKDSKD